MVGHTVQKDPDVIEGNKIAKKLLKTYLFIGATCVVGAVVSGPVGVSVGVGVGAALGCVAAGYVALGVLNVGYKAVSYGVNKASGLIFKSKSGIKEFKNSRNSLAQQYEHYEEVFARMRQQQTAQATTQSARRVQRSESVIERNYRAQSVGEAKKTVNGKMAPKKQAPQSAVKVETKAFNFGGLGMGAAQSEKD